MNTSSLWNPAWDQLLPGLEFSPGLEGALDMKSVIHDWHPLVMTWDGVAKPSALTHGFYLRSADVLTAYAAAFRRQAASVNFEPLTRADAAHLYSLMVACEGEASLHHHSALLRPTTSFAEMFMLMMDLQILGEISSDVPDWQNLVRQGFREHMRSFADHALDALAYYANPPSVGLRKSEKKAALKACQGAYSSRAKEEFLVLWQSAGGKPVEGESLWSVYAAGLAEVYQALKITKARNKGPWGREAVLKHFEQLLIQQSPEELLAWAVSNMTKILAVMNEVARLMVPGARDWRDALKRYPFSTASTDEDLLIQYQTKLVEVIASMRGIGLLPADIPAGCEIAIGWTSESAEAMIPVGACTPAGREGSSRVSRINVTSPHGDKARLRDHAFGHQGLLAHEGTHAVQAHHGPAIPYGVQMCAPLSILGAEGSAFSQELLALDLGAISRDLPTFLYVLSGRLQRAVRVVFELKYHLGLFPETREAIRWYARKCGMTYESAAADCERAMAQVGTFSGYYIGAAMAQNMVVASGESPVKVHREWIQYGAAHVAPQLWAFMKGWTDNPFKLFQVLPDDAGVDAWNRAKEAFLPK